jgi:two-component system chemotaxis response regulator CheY
MGTKRVLSVGQCWADHGGISRTLKQAFGAEVESADDTETALDTLRQGGFSLVLVNRVFDATGASGVDLIRRVKADPDLRDVPVMLVSNYEEAQAEAAAAGAAPGFGKAALVRSQMLERLRPYLAPGG